MTDKLSEVGATMTHETEHNADAGLAFEPLVSLYDRGSEPCPGCGRPRLYCWCDPHEDDPKPCAHNPLVG